MNASDRMIDDLENQALSKSFDDIEFDINLNSECRDFMTMIEDIYYSVAKFDANVTLEQNLQNPDLVMYGISGEYLRLILREYVSKFIMNCLL